MGCTSFLLICKKKKLYVDLSFCYVLILQLIDAIKNVVQPELNKKANTDASNLTSTDVSKWQEKLGTGTVETLHANGIIQGYPDGTFKGDQPMSRSEYAKMIYELAEKLTTPNN